MKFSTPVQLPECPLKLTPQSHVMLVGSCFTEHIGRHLGESMSPTRLSVNPNGILYNPGSLYNSLIDLMAPCYDFSRPLAFEAADGLWHHWHYSTLFSEPSREALEARLKQQWEDAHRVFSQLDLLLVTFSTDHAYCLNEGPLEGTIVANCHKQPARLFNETILDPGQLQEMWDMLLHQLRRSHPQLQVVFTLSPYRYYKYGLHENALSKARLLLLIDHLCRNHEQASYFPAFEIVTDELRDYRFYAPDMLHPTEQAADYVWERFCDWAFTNDMKIYARERQALQRDLNHRPLHPDSEEYIRFRSQVEERRRLFEKKWNEKWS